MDILISVFGSSLVPILLARRWFRFDRPIGIWDVAPTETWRMGRLLQDFIWPRVDHFFLLSSWQAGYVKQWSRHARCHFVGQHIDTDFYQPFQRSHGEFILSVGEDIGRDFGTYVKALHDARLQSERFVIKTRQEIAVPSSLAANLAVIAERITYCELRALYSRAKFVVVPLHRCLNVSGVGTVLEAMAMGKAVIVSDSATLRDYIVAGETCLVVEPENPRDLREAIIYLLRHPEIADRLGARGREFAVENFSHEAFAKRMAAAIRAALR